jgi:nucleoside-triphosphatase
MNILITGRPGVGKTTLIKEISHKIGENKGGFYTEEIRKSGRRIGFRIKTLDGKTGLLSGIDVESPYRVGKYKVDLEDFENTALPAVEDALSNSKAVIIDEIGPMELFSRRFKELVVKALDSPNPVIATIKLKRSKFIDKVKTRDDTVLYDLGRTDKEEILAAVLKNISKE